MDKEDISIPIDYPTELQTKILGYIPGGTNAIVRGDKHGTAPNNLDNLCRDFPTAKEFKRYITKVALNMFNNGKMIDDGNGNHEVISAIYTYGISIDDNENYHLLKLEEKYRNSRRFPCIVTLDIMWEESKFYIRVTCTYLFASISSSGIKFKLWDKPLVFSSEYTDMKDKETILRLIDINIYSFIFRKSSVIYTDDNTFTNILLSRPSCKYDRESAFNRVKDKMTKEKIITDTLTPVAKVPEELKMYLLSKLIYNLETRDELKDYITREIDASNSTDTHKKHIKDILLPRFVKGI